MYALPSIRTVSLITLFSSAIIACGGEQRAEGPTAPPPAVVKVVEAAPETIRITGEYTGRVRGLRDVEVRAQVAGILQERRYQEGSDVEDGQSLFLIEPEPFKVALRAAQAEQADADAALAQAQREWDRHEQLFASAAVSRRDYDRAQADLALTKARQQRASAAVAEARLNLQYTEVKAPISGVTELEAVSEGTLVERGVLLTRITQRDPVRVVFALPERDAQQLRRGGTSTVELQWEDESAYGHQGQLDFAGSTVDERLGTVTARAQFPNPDRQLIPGQFVRLSIVLEVLENSFAVDPRALVRGRNGPRIFVATSAGIAEERSVELGPVVDGKQVIREGIVAGERIIVEGQIMLRDGAPVQVADEEQAD